MNAPITTIITCHANADWDALASMTGLWMLYPNAALLFPGSMTPTITQYYQDHIQTSYPCLTQKELDNHPITTLVIADTAHISRVPAVEPLLKRASTSLHIWDHHPQEIPETSLEHSLSSTSMPQAPLADITTPYDITIPYNNIASVGSTVTLVCEALKQHNIHIQVELATLLGLGLYADTGHFTYASTGPRDLHAAVYLLEQGMELQRINILLTEAQTSEYIHTLSEIIDNAQIHTLGMHTITISTASSEDFIPNFSKIVQELLNIQPCDALFVLGSMKDKVMLVARSTSEDLDVGIICKAFGGGGHSYAASASIKNKLPAEIIDTIFQQMYAQIHPHKLAKDLMSTPPISLEAELSIKEAENIMNRYGLKAAPVVETGTANCIGYIECQIASRAITHGLGSLAVAEYMQRRVLTATPNTSLQDLIDIVVGARQRLVPVVQDDTLIGVVTRTDLINMFMDTSGQRPLLSPKNRRARSLAKTLQTRLPSATYNMLIMSGELADELNVKLYVVGGLVRDILLKATPTNKEDMDMVVEGEGLKFAKALAAKLGGRVREHKTFMTSIVIYHDKDKKERRIDVATARLEYYEYPAALPSVELSSIKMDLFRRDFTINAMAIRLNSKQFGHLVDFFGGQNDTKNRNLRVIHALSFVEDPTRILRAIRFEQRFDLRIISQTEKLIQNALELQLLDKVSGPRILHELELIFQEKNPAACYERLQDFELLQAIHPALQYNEERAALLQRSIEVLDWYTMLYQNEKPQHQILYLVALMSTTDDTLAKDILKRLGTHETFTKTILATRHEVYCTQPKIQQWYHIHGSISQLWKMLQPLSLESLLMLMARSHDESINRTLSHYITKWRLTKIDINGKDLYNLGLEEGPRYGVILRNVLMEKLDKQIITREDQLQYAEKFIQNFIENPKQEQPL